MTDLRDRIDNVRAAHHAAEVLYVRLLTTPNADLVRLAGANARAEGLAEAVGMLTGLDVVDVRAHVRGVLDRERGAGLAGVAGARAELEARRR